MTGAFTSLDSYAGQAIDPLSMNRFLYAEANPSSFVDPTGHGVDCGMGEQCSAADRSSDLAASAARTAPKPKPRSVTADDKIETAYLAKKVGGATAPPLDPHRYDGLCLVYGSGAQYEPTCVSQYSYNDGSQYDPFWGTFFDSVGQGIAGGVVVGGCAVVFEVCGPVAVLVGVGATEITVASQVKSHVIDGQPWTPVELAQLLGTGAVVLVGAGAYKVLALGTPNLLSKSGPSGGPGLPMTMESVCDVACKYGIELTNSNPISINKSVLGPSGSTSRLGTITLYRNAFQSEQELAMTLVHELYHAGQLRAGLPYPDIYNPTSTWELAAEQAAQEWWTTHPLNRTNK